MKRTARFCLALALIAASLYAGTALAGRGSTPKYVFPVQATMINTHKCVKVGQTLTYTVQLVNTSGRTVDIRVPADGMDNTPYTFTYVSSTPAITTETHSGQNPDGSTYTWYERYWLLQIKPGGTKVLSITGIAPDWNVIPVGAPPDYTPEPWPVHTGFSVVVPGKYYGQYLGYTSPYCGLVPPYWGGGK